MTHFLPMASDSTDSLFEDADDEEFQEAEQRASHKAAKLLLYKEAVIAAQSPGVDIMHLSPDDLINMMLPLGATPSEKQSTIPPATSSKGKNIYACFFKNKFVVVSSFFNHMQ